MAFAARHTPSYRPSEQSPPRPQPAPESAPPFRDEDLRQTTENVKHSHNRLKEFGVIAVTAAAVVALAIVAHHQYNKRKAAGQTEPVAQDIPRPDPTRDWSRAVQPIPRTRPIEPVQPPVTLQTDIITRPVRRIHLERSEAPQPPVRLRARARTRIQKAMSLSTLFTTASLVAQLLTSSQAPLDTRITTDPIPPTPVTIIGPRPTEQAPIVNPPAVPSRAAETPLTGQSQGDQVTPLPTPETTPVTTPASLPVETPPVPSPVPALPVEASATVPPPAATESPAAANASPTPTETLVAPTLRPLIDEAVAQFGIPSGLMHAILYTESRGGLLDANIAGHKGDLAQMLPEMFTDSVLGTHDRVQLFAKHFNLDLTLDDDTLRQQLLDIYDGVLTLPHLPAAQQRVQMFAMAAYLQDRVGTYPVNPQDPESFLLAGLAYNAPGTAATTLSTLRTSLGHMDPSFTNQSYEQQVAQSNQLLADILRAYYGLPLRDSNRQVTVTATTAPKTSEQEDNMPYTQLNLSVTVTGEEKPAQSFELHNVQYLVKPKENDLPPNKDANVGIGNNLLANMQVPVG